MIYRLELLDGAMSDIEETFLWYQAISPHLRDRFQIQLNISLKGIHSNPLAFHLLGIRARCKKINYFPYLVIFAVQSDLISVVAIIHEKRNPKIWKRRIRQK